MIQSMSAKGDCWDNAPTESFFKTLKVEEVHTQIFKTRSEAARTIFQYVEIFYNRHRLHSTLGYLSPEEFETQHAIKQLHSNTALTTTTSV